MSEQFEDLTPTVQRELMGLHQDMAGLSQDQINHVYWTLRLLRSSYEAENAVFVPINDRVGRLAIAEWLAANGHVDVEVDTAVEMWLSEMASTLLEGDLHG